MKIKRVKVCTPAFWTAVVKVKLLPMGAMEALRLCRALPQIKQWAEEFEAARVAVIRKHGEPQAAALRRLLGEEAQSSKLKVQSEDGGEAQTLNPQLPNPQPIRTHMDDGTPIATVLERLEALPADKMPWVLRPELAAAAEAELQTVLDEELDLPGAWPLVIEEMALDLWARTGGAQFTVAEWEAVAWMLEVQSSKLKVQSDGIHRIQRLDLHGRPVPA